MRGEGAGCIFLQRIIDMGLKLYPPISLCNRLFITLKMTLLFQISAEFWGCPEDTSCRLCDEEGPEVEGGLSCVAQDTVDMQ